MKNLAGIRPGDGEEDPNLALADEVGLDLQGIASEAVLLVRVKVGRGVKAQVLCTPSRHAQ